MSTPIIVVAAIMQVTGVWNDYLLGLVFAGRDNLPMTVQLNNVINTTTGTREYNVNMAATVLTSLVPLGVVFCFGAMVCERDYGGRSEVTDLKDTILGRIALLQMFALLVYCCALRPSAPSLIGLLKHLWFSASLEIE